uniref:TIR domain-containing protein n=1 Tax=Sinocyclocheilus grahami TaxID=75366 RepID=A0A672PEC0_SINGR
MCLILLKRIGEAHAKLTANSDSNIGKYLAEMVKMHGECVNSSHIGGFKSTDANIGGFKSTHANMLLDIARIFYVLVQERLCDKSLRDQTSPEPSQSDVEETFYDFVILHEAEDADEAQRLKDKLERIISGVGATFSDDFAQPGRSTLRCMEDAIENLAFTLLLLTQNFISNHSATSADSAIVNSLENRHKMNSVIPLLPRKNCLLRKSFPLVLQTKVPLDKSRRMFEHNAQKAIATEKVATQKKIWMIKQHRKKLVEEQRTP